MQVKPPPGSSNNHTRPDANHEHIPGQSPTSQEKIWSPTFLCHKGRPSKTLSLSILRCSLRSSMLCSSGTVLLALCDPLPQKLTLPLIFVGHPSTSTTYICSLSLLQHLLTHTGEKRTFDLYLPFRALVHKPPIDAFFSLCVPPLVGVPTITHPAVQTHICAISQSSPRMLVRNGIRSSQ